MGEADEIPMAVVAERGVGGEGAVRAVEYARPKGVSGEVYGAAKWQLAVTVFSPLTIVACWLVAAPVWVRGVGILVVLGFVGVVALAVTRTPRDVAGSHRRVWRLVGERGAMGALVVLGLVVVLRDEGGRGEGELTVAGLCFLVMAATSFRTGLACEVAAGWAREVDAVGLARWMKVMGILRAWFETLWLLCVAVGCFCVALRAEDVGVVVGLGALFGLPVYGGFWVWAVAMQAGLVMRLGQRRRFEV